MCQHPCRDWAQALVREPRMGLWSDRARRREGPAGEQTRKPKEGSGTAWANGGHTVQVTAGPRTSWSGARDWTTAETTCWASDHRRLGRSTPREQRAGQRCPLRLLRAPEGCRPLMRRLKSMAAAWTAEMGPSAVWKAGQRTECDAGPVGHLVPPGTGPMDPPL
jgi:hypothetical protein